MAKKTGNLNFHWALFLLALPLIILGCNNGISTYQNSQSSIDCVDEAIFQKQDTFRLMCVNYACDCPAWVDYKKYMQYLKANNIEGGGFDTLFNDHYYLEQAGGIPYPLEQDRAGIIVDFYGQIDTIKRLSKEPIYMDPEPIKGKIMMYKRFRTIQYAPNW